MSKFVNHTYGYSRLLGIPAFSLGNRLCVYMNGQQYMFSIAALAKGWGVTEIRQELLLCGTQLTHE